MKITGTEFLIEALAKGANLDGVKQVVKTNTSSLQNKAQRYAPVDTGNLKRSIRLGLEDGGFTGRVVADTEYAMYVEMGTRFISARPYLRPSLNEVEIQFQSDLARIFR